MWNELLLLMGHELSLTILLFVLLFIKLGEKESSAGLNLGLINILLLINFICGLVFHSTGTLFNGMFITNDTLSFEKDILNFGTLLISMQASNWLKTHKHAAEFYMLLIATLCGMFFMISSGNLMMFYLGLELSTIPLAALCNFDLEKRTSSEAAMKMIMSSAFSSGLLLFGISLIYGTTGTLVFSDLGQHLDGSALQLFAFVLLFSGFAFKMSVVPFHLWTADVYEGSPVAVTAYLSVISKGAITFVFVSVLYTIFKSFFTVWYMMLFIAAVATMLIGNLFAIRQQNLKRFLAFSSIAQVGFILIGISGSSQAGMTSVIYFILIYVFSNLAAFGVIATVSALTGKEKIDDYKGFYQTNPMLSWVLTIALFSLAGVPPTSGFFGKFFLITAGAERHNYVLITIAALNMVISMYYYLRIVKAIFMDKNDQPIERLQSGVLTNLSLVICVTGIVVIGMASEIYNYINTLSFGF